jgi:hypothetical protein
MSSNVLAWSLVLLCGATSPGAPPPVINPKFDLAQTRIEWTKGLDAALGRDRPILLFELLGNFDDAFC